MAESELRRWLSFSNNDQKVLREDLQGRVWDGLVVPGTLATYYKQGVGGYVLARRRPFVIDPRTPLVQDEQITPRPEPKASHIALAAVHHPDLEEPWAEGIDPPLEFWTRERWESTVRSVVEFQTSFEQEAAEKIEKYETMLQEGGRSLDLDRPVTGPERLIPPYFAVRGQQDPWWNLSRTAIEQAVTEHPPARIMPVLCLRRDAPTDQFAELLADLPGGIESVFCWRGSWDEATATNDDVAGWLRAVDVAAGRDAAVLNMYGGALSVYLTGRGLYGVNHGIGYSESRDERRLSQTGAAQMRYYVPRLRAFYSVPTAQRFLDLLTEGNEEWRCDCAVCSKHSESIVDMTTEELKMHFLIARAKEYRAAPDVSAVVADLRTNAAELHERFPHGSIHHEPVLYGRGEVLARWADFIEQRY